MKITRAQLKETLRTIMKEESEYQQFFRKALDKAGKSITDMSDDEKKAFFTKIDAAWDGKGEKNEGNAFGAAVVAAKKAGKDEFEVGGETYKVKEELVGNQKKLDVDGDGEIEASDLAALRAGKKTNEARGLNKSYVMYLSVDKKLKELEAAQKQMAQQYFAETDEKKKAILLDKLKKGTKILQATRKNLNDLETNYVMNLDKDAEYQGESVVNEGSHGMATKLLKSIVSGDTKHAEGIKMSKELAQHYINWISSSPFGKKNSNLPLYMLVNASFNWGIERGLNPKLKGELAKLKDSTKKSANEAIAVGKMVKVVDNPHWEASLGKKGPFKRKVKMIDGDNVFFTDGSNSSMKYVKETTETVNEGRAFINAAKKAKAEGKTEFEFNGKKYPVTIKD